MAAKLFSTSLPHSNEVEVKKSFIQPSEPEPPAGNHDDNGDNVQANDNDGEERDSWQEIQPTLRERSAQCSALIGRQYYLFIYYQSNITV